MLKRTLKKQMNTKFLYIYINALQINNQKTKTLPYSLEK